MQDTQTTASGPVTVYSKKDDPALVLRGSDDWLYLHNDGNMSVEQYVGKVTLSDAAAQRWKDYFNSLLQLRAEIGFAAVQLFAPAKESVYEEFYPHRANRAAIRPIDSVLALVPPDLPSVYPAALFRSLQGPFPTYDKGDSHWNAFGSAVAAVAALRKIGCELPDPLSFRYREKLIFGDLDGKILPEPISPRVYWPKLRHHVVKTFDSQCENHGKVGIYCNPQAPDRSLLILGDSFANAIQPVLAPYFRRVVRVHGHSLDSRILKLERPDYLLCLMAERFVCRPPPDPNGYDVRNVMREKFSKLPAAELSKLRADYAAAIDGPERPWVEFLMPALPE